ncbi:MAG: substrate-binding domain-containing protein, partial [Clostridia bacterium]
RELASTYGLSKNTVNTVIAMLVNDGLAQVHEGMGTFVSCERKHARMIGVMLFDFSGGMRVDTGILEHIQKNITRDYYLSLVDTSNRFDVFCDGLERLLSLDAAGLLIIPPKEAPPDEAALRRVQALLKRCPTVFMVRSVEGVEADFYSMDLRKGVADAMEYFATSGKRRTGLILHDASKFVQEELEAYRACQRLYGLEEGSSYLIEWNERMEVLREKLLRILPQIDSLIAPDNILVQLQEALKADGRVIPRELSLVGINDTLSARLFNPPLTSLAFPVERIGRHA